MDEAAQLAMLEGDAGIEVDSMDIGFPLDNLSSPGCSGEPSPAPSTAQMLAGLSLKEREKPFSETYLKRRDVCLLDFGEWTESDQVDFVKCLLSQMCHYQHGQINAYLKPMLQRDFISLLPARGLSHLAESILMYLDAKALCYAELVCKEWRRVVADGSLWKKLIERKVHYDSLWKGLSEKRGWKQYLYKAKDRLDARGVDTSSSEAQHAFYRRLYPQIVTDIENIENNWKCGRHVLQRINCHSEASKGPIPKNLK